ncbi:MAG: tRNA (guanosine(46)-N7)-methyltransferase TrmB [Planctomycetaceae bacterium]|nr:tRNA (guanosine(46)-N7)-methyltransferase TrmB [Planctomycetaceae bacterium]
MVHKTLHLYPQIVLGADQLSGMLDFECIFGRSGPIELEVGSGKGTFLYCQAKACPDTFFIGIEWSSKYYKFAIDRMGRWGITNVRLLRTDAAQFIRDHVPDASISAFHLYFPDPWPKKKHHKRRFFNDDNLSQLFRILRPGGIINTATDHEDYYMQMRQAADRAIAAGQFEEIDFVRPAGAFPGEIVGTNYERKYMKEGRKTYILALRKK